MIKCHNYLHYFYIKFIGIKDLSIVGEPDGSWSSISFNSEMYLTATFPTSDLNEEMVADINIEWPNGSIDMLKVAPLGAKMVALSDKVSNLRSFHMLQES